MFNLEKKDMEARVSSAMFEGIAELEREYGELRKVYGFEVDECNHYEEGYYDYCELWHPLICGGCIFAVVAHDGTVSRY